MRMHLHLLIGCVALFGGGSESLLAQSGLLRSGPTVRPNVFGPSPLSATVTFETTQPTTVRGVVVGDHPFEFEANVATRHILPIVGLRPATENRVQLTVTAASGGVTEQHVVVVRTGPLPGFLPSVEVRTSAGEGRMPWTLVHFAVADSGYLRSVPLLLDPAGEVRWFLDPGPQRSQSYVTHLSDRGHILTPNASWITERDPTGRLVRRRKVHSTGIHHELVAGAAEHLLTIGGVYEAETVLQLSTSDLATTRRWRLRQYLPTIRNTIAEAVGDPYHANSVSWSPDDGALVVSARNLGVVKIHRAKGLLWVLAPHAGWADSEAARELPLLTAVDEDGTPLPQAVQDGVQRSPDFAWPVGQHDARPASDGRLLLFDNRLETPDPDGMIRSRIVEYRIDEAASTVAQTWSYGDNGEIGYSPIISSVRRTARGDLLVTAGFVTDHRRHARLILVDPVSSTELWRADLVFNDVLAIRKGNQERDKQGFGYSDIVYRAEPVDPLELWRGSLVR